MSPQQHMDLPALRTIPFFALEWTRPPTCVSMLAQKWTGPHEQGAVSVISAFITPSLFQSRLKTYFYNILPTNTIVDFWYSLGCLHGSLNWAGLITLIGLVLVHFTGPLPRLQPAGGYCFWTRQMWVCLSVVCPSGKMVQSTSRKVHIPGRVCLLCCALRIFLFVEFSV